MSLFDQGPTMSLEEFRLLRELVNETCGIRFESDAMYAMERRLRERLTALGLTSYRAYYQRLRYHPDAQAELENAVDVLTTNETYFFREAYQLEVLEREILPELKERNARSKRLTIWSAGCSTGEEPYTLAMVLSDFAARWPGFGFSILGTDISGEVLKKAVAGIYDHQKIAPVPMPMRKKYLLRSKDRTRNVVRVIPEIRSRVTFQRLNLMESDFRLRESFDVIFFRNVIIYFDRPTQERVLHSVCRHLKPEGALFLGHSETLNGLNVPLKPVVSTVYRKVA